MAGNLFMIKATAITLPPGDFFLRHFNNEGELDDRLQPELPDRGSHLRQTHSFDQT